MWHKGFKELIHLKTYHPLPLIASDHDLRVCLKEINSTKTEMNNFIWYPSNWALIRTIDKEGKLHSANRGLL